MTPPASGAPAPTPPLGAETTGAFASLMQFSFPDRMAAHLPSLQAALTGHLASFKDLARPAEAPSVFVQTLSGLSRTYKTATGVRHILRTTTLRHALTQPEDAVDPPEGGQPPEFVGRMRAYACNVMQATSKRHNDLWQVGSLRLDIASGRMAIHYADDPDRIDPADTAAFEAVASLVAQRLAVQVGQLNAERAKAFLEGVCKALGGFQYLNIGNSWILPNPEFRPDGDAPDLLSEDNPLVVLRQVAQLLTLLGGSGVRILITPLYPDAEQSILDIYGIARSEAELQLERRMRVAIPKLLRLVTRDDRVLDQHITFRREELNKLLADAELYQLVLSAEVEDVRRVLGLASSILESQAATRTGIPPEELDALLQDDAYLRLFASTSSHDDDFDNTETTP